MSHSVSASPVEVDLDVVAGRLRAAGCVFAEDEARMLLGDASDRSRLAAMIERRVAGEPLEHVLGWAEFCGLRIAVDTGVFVPRRRTEFLVEQAAALATAMPGGARTVVDLCCGSGALAAALVAKLGQVEAYAVDIDPASVRCARRNLSGGVLHGDLYEPLPTELRGRVNVLVANSPYVPSAAIGLLPPEARLHEPLLALDGGADGLVVQRRVIADAPRWLSPGGVLLVETSESQEPLTTGAVRRSGMIARTVRCPDLEATVVVAAMP